MAEQISTNVKTRISISPPNKWNVVFLNDDVTPMELVIEILTEIFHHTAEAAEKLTLEIHNSGHAVVGTYIYEIAEQKGLEATAIARDAGFPLQIKVEETK